MQHVQKILKYEYTKYSNIVSYCYIVFFFFLMLELKNYELLL